MCNFLQLYQETSDEKYKDFALKLVDQVHSTLGQYKHGAKKGWISGLSQDEGEKNTINKKMEWIFEEQLSSSQFFL